MVREASVTLAGRWRKMTSTCRGWRCIPSLRRGRPIDAVRCRRTISFRRGCGRRNVIRHRASLRALKKTRALKSFPKAAFPASGQETAVLKKKKKVLFSSMCEEYLFERRRTCDRYPTESGWALGMKLHHFLQRTRPLYRQEKDTRSKVPSVSLESRKILLAPYVTTKKKASFPTFSSPPIRI